MSDEKKTLTSEEAFERFFLQLKKTQEEQMALATARDAERLEAARRRTKYERNDFWQNTQAYNRQERCKHLKGTAGGKQLGSLLTEKNPIPWTFYNDYNVGMHTFITGETKIWCLCGCGWYVWNRPGWHYKFQVGLKMVQNSSNHPSMSEIPYKNWTDCTLTDGLRPYTVTVFDGPPSMLDPNEHPIRGLAINRKKPE